MTRPSKRSLLEDFVDSELSEEETSYVRQLLAQSPELQQEHDATLRLREILKTLPVPDPGEQYWSESTELILARTTPSETEESVNRSLPEITAQKRHAFWRSVVSAAASLIILFSALVIGSQRQTHKETNIVDEGRMLVTTDLADRLTTPTVELTDQPELAGMTVRNILQGPPGHVGRFSDPTETMPMK